MRQGRGGRGRLLARVAVAAALWLGLGGWTPAGASLAGDVGRRAVAMELLPGFIDETVLSDLPPVTAMAWAPDGRLFLARKDGQVLIYQNGTLLSQPFVDLSAQVNTWADRGMLGMTLHPQFETYPYVYLFYVYDPPDLPALNDPSSPDGNGARASRLLRVTADPNNPNQAQPGSELVLLGSNSTLTHMGAWNVDGNTPTYPPPGCVTGGTFVSDCLPADGPSHTAGMLRFGPDGALYAGYGDGAGVVYPDARALRTLSLDSLAGKLLRINPDTGQGYPNNPFYDGDLSSNRSRVYALGLRNPFRFDFQPGTNEIVIGDVGWNDWEEINLGRGKNFGWPCYEGMGQQPYYATANDTQAACQSLYAQGAAAWTPPAYTYPHVPLYSGSIILGEFYSGVAFPPEHQGSLFFADFAVNWIKVLRFETDTSVTISPFAQLTQISWDGPVQVARGPDDNLYYLTIGPAGSTLHRIRYVEAGNRPPIVKLTANPTNGGAPLQVHFSSAGTVDPDGQALTYAWSFGDGGESSEPEADHTYAVTGTYTASLTVWDEHLWATTAHAQISAGNHAPTATILTPAAGALFAVGDQVNFTGAGTDWEDGALSGAQLEWSMLMHHQEHVHLNALPPTSGASGSFAWPDHGDNTWLELCLTVHDTGELAASDCRPLWPATTHWDVRTQPLGLQVLVNGVGRSTPFDLTVQVGAVRSLAAPLTQYGFGFTGWEHGGPAAQTITATNESRVLTAVYDFTMPPVAWLPVIGR